MGQVPSLPVEHARLLFSRNSLSNNTIQCDALGLHYQLSTPTDGMKNTRVTMFSKWDAGLQKDVPIAEWERKLFGSDRLRMAPGYQLVTDDIETEDGFTPVSQLFPRTHGLPGSVHVNRTFTASNGKRYTWKSRQLSLALYSEENPGAPIATYSGCFYSRDKPHIKLAPGCEDIMDYLVLTCVIAERKRRDAKRQQHSSGGD